MNQSKTIFLLLTLAAGSPRLLAQQRSGAVADSTVRAQLTELAKSGTDSAKAALDKKLYGMLKSRKEADWLLAREFFYREKKQGTADSITKAAQLKFPAGAVVRNEAVSAIYDEKDPQRKEEKYQAWLKKFSPERIGDQSIVYDYASNSIATAWAEAGNVQKAWDYAGRVQTAAWKGEGWAGPGVRLLKSGKFKESVPFFQKAVEIAQEFRTTRKNEPGAGFAAMGYPGYCTYAAEALSGLGQYEEALTYVEKAAQGSDKVRGNVNALYAKLLHTLGRPKEAFDQLDAALKAGQASPAMMDSLKVLYVQLHGNADGYESYLAAARKEQLDKILKELPGKMIDEPVLPFTLKDLDGNTVSISDFKGKTVVLDFWATWCGPCKASFPAMQMAVNKYRDDPNVVFLFIHTWEKTDTAVQTVRHFLTNMNYSFRVLMDLKDPVTASNKVVEQFGISGIPTKLIIDGKGRIRFRLTGFEGGNDAAVAELSAMIGLASQHS